MESRATSLSGRLLPLLSPSSSPPSPGPRSRRAPTRTSRSRSSRPCSRAAASTSSRARSAERLGKALGQSIVVENQSGGGGIVGSQADRARRAGRLHADGRLRRHARHEPGGAQAAVRRGTRFHADRDGRRHAERPGGAAVAAGQDAGGVHRLREGEQGQAVVRLGGPGHAHAPRDGAVQGRPPTSTCSTCPYRGIGPAITDILGGQTQALFPGLAAALPHIKAGKMQPLAVTGPKRHPLLPDVPTFEELGYKGFDGVQWYGIVGPGEPAAGDRDEAQHRDQQAARQSRIARAAVRRGARADADDAGASSASTCATTSRNGRRWRRNATSRSRTDINGAAWRRGSVPWPDR